MSDKAITQPVGLISLLLATLPLFTACTQNPTVAAKEAAPAAAAQPASEEPAETVQRVTNPHFAKIVAAPTKAEKDHAAILAMQGEYQVDFDFAETVVLQEGYERRPEKHSAAFETVLVLESTPERIVLQHLLVMGAGRVIKHWRQDWEFQASERFEFVSDQTWQVRPIAADQQKGYWTQCVYEVSDAPRYCGTGRWNHRYGVSTWTSDRSWRPLPRREYTVREDYNALNVENRHTITPQGWTHEQDNTKAIREGEKTQATLVREFGFNNYRSVEGYDFSPAYAYWEKTAPYWLGVRQSWAQRFKDDKQVVINTEVDGMPIIEATFSQAEAIEKGEQEAPKQSDIDAVLDQWVSAAILK